MAGRRDWGSPGLPTCICSHIALHKAIFAAVCELDSAAASVDHGHDSVHSQTSGLHSFREPVGHEQVKVSVDGMRKA